MTHARQKLGLRLAGGLGAIAFLCCHPREGDRFLTRLDCLRFERPVSHHIGLEHLHRCGDASNLVAPADIRNIHVEVVRCEPPHDVGHGLYRPADTEQHDRQAATRNGHRDDQGSNEANCLDLILGGGVLCMPCDQIHGSERNVADRDLRRGRPLSRQAERVISGSRPFDNASNVFAFRSANGPEKNPACAPS